MGKRQLLPIAIYRHLTTFRCLLTFWPGEVGRHNNSKFNVVNLSLSGAT